MSRVNFIVEGLTEQLFVNTVLGPHLAALSVFCFAHQITTNRSKRARGGFVNYDHAKNDIVKWSRQERATTTFFTTMFDLYGLPANFPGYEQAATFQTHGEKVQHLEETLKHDIGDYRFIPYIQVHEFEALLLTDPQQFDWEFFEHENEIQKLVSLSRDFPSPEEINEGHQTAPSKRIISVIPEYSKRKASSGPIIASHIGLAKMRAACPHFNAWIQHLEALAEHD